MSQLVAPASRRSRRTPVEPVAAQESPMSQIVVEDLTAESVAPVAPVAPVTSAEPETTAPKREVSEAAKAALKEYQEASKKAKAFLAEVILGKHPHLVLPNEVLEAIRVLVPIRNAKQGHAAPRNAKQQVLDKLLDLFMANDGKVTLMQVFKEFRMGEGEMRVRMRNAIHDRKPEERMWITYDSDTETYTLEEVGVNPPAGWTGALPKNK